MSGLIVEDLAFAYGASPVLRGITLPPLLPGRVTAVIGPNAAGKSTFFKCLAGLLASQGSLWLDGVNLKRLTSGERARRIAYLPQETAVQAVLTVFEAVLLARQHAITWRVRDDDLAAVGRVLGEMRLTELALRYLNELSGGQRQLVSIAQALAREPRVLLLDEPTSHLDLQHQLEVLARLRRATLDRELITLFAVHDLNLAARYADHLIVLAGGTIYAAGTAEAVLTPTMLRAVYGVHGTVAPGPDGRPQVTPLAPVPPPAAVPG